MKTLWSRDDGLIDVTSAFQGITQPLSEITDDIHRRGWTVNKIHIKDGSYVAEGKSPHGDKLEANGRTDATAAANLLVKIMRQEHMRSSAVKAKLGAWDHVPIEQQFSAIAQAYAGAPIYEPKAAVAWMELAQDCARRAQTIRMQLSIEYTDDPVPYDSADEMREDVTKKRHILVTRAYPHHPIWSEQQMLDYRLTVDVLGHALGGGDWGWHGTCLAFAALAPMLAETPQKALFTELLGQSAFGTFYRQWGPQKICFLDELIEKQQEGENKPGHTGVHPTQSIVPTAMPSIFSKVAASTRTQLLQQKHELDEQWPDRMQIEHRWPDGWTVRSPTTYADVHRQGELLGNCLSLHNPACIALTDHPNWPKDAEGEPVDSAEMLTPDQLSEVVANLDQPIPAQSRSWRERSLHDPDGLPRVVFTQSRGIVDNVLGRHNSDPKPEYLERLSDYAQQYGMDPVGDENVREDVEGYQDPTDWEDHRQAAVVGTPADPNADWESGVAPLQDNAYLWQRQDGVDPLGSENLSESLRTLEPGLTRLHPQMAKQAVTNALRSSLLGSRTNPMAHARHYQDVMHIPADVDDPMAYYDALEQQREHHNQAQGYAPNSHKQHWPEEQQFKQWVKAVNPHLDDGDVDREARREMLHMLIEEEERVLAADQGEQLPAEVIEHEAYEALRRRLKALTKPTVDQKVDFGEDHLWHEASSDRIIFNPRANRYHKGFIDSRDQVHVWPYPEVSRDATEEEWRQSEEATSHAQIATERNVDIGPRFVLDRRELWPDDPAEWDPGHTELVKEQLPGLQIIRTSTHHADMYPPFLASRLRPMAQVSRHATALTEAAKEDLQTHKGRGHHFRATALSLGIPGLGPRQVSHAWQYLAPQTSQLAIVNPEVAEILGHNYQTDTTNRDYFKHERELAAGRDASGYGHVPLGAFSTGLWDLYAHGPGVHPDRTAFKAHGPAPHHAVDWQAQAPTFPGWTDPYWWASTAETRDGAAQDFDRTVGINFPTDEVPFQKTAARPYYRWLPASIRDEVTQNGMVPNPNTGNPMHFWDNLENARQYGEICNSIEPHDLWEVQGRPGRLKRDPWFKMMAPGTYPEYGDRPGAWQGDADHIPPERLRRLGADASGAALSTQIPLPGRSPWVVHPTQGIVDGQPGQSLMQHMKTVFGGNTHDIWQLAHACGKGDAPTSLSSSPSAIGDDSGPPMSTLPDATDR